MADTLILMRHGKAQRLAEGQQDFDRALTEAGKRSLDAMLPCALAFIDNDAKRLEIWSSPALRAVQSAELMRKALRRRGIKVSGGIQTLDCLWDQDEQALLQFVRQSEADTVIAVGHNPFIESLTKHLTGASIPYATGGFAAIRINWTEEDDSIPSPDETYAQAYGLSRLLWFSQGPISQRWKTLVQLEKALSNGARTMQTRYDAFFADPDDIETMHKFRVSIRTLRSLLAFTSAWQDPRQVGEVQSDLKALVAETSRLRELDVLYEQAAAAATSEELVEFCAAQAAAERKRVMKALSGKAPRKRLDNVNDELSRVRWKKRFNALGLADTDVRKRFDEMVDELRDDLDTLDLGDVEHTHDVRKDAKRARYVAERFTDIVGEDAIDIAKGMTDQQDRLGAICDARVNIDIISSFEQDDLPESVAWDLALLRAQNETFLYTTLRDAR